MSTSSRPAKACPSGTTATYDSTTRSSCEKPCTAVVWACSCRTAVNEAAKRQHTPKVAFVAKPASYVSSSGKQVAAGEIDLLVRAMSMGKLHHAMMGTAAVAIGTAAAIPGTLVNLAAGGGEKTSVRFGHPSGTLMVGAEAALADGAWSVTKAIMSRSARVLMEGVVRIPGDAF